MLNFSSPPEYTLTLHLNPPPFSRIWIWILVFLVWSLESRFWFAQITSKKILTGLAASRSTSAWLLEYMSASALMSARISAYAGSRAKFLVSFGSSVTDKDSILLKEVEKGYAEDQRCIFIMWKTLFKASFGGKIKATSRPWSEANKI